MNTLGRVMTSALLICLLIMQAGCSMEYLFAAKPYKETQFMMDTIIEITAYGNNSESAVKAAFAEFERINNLTNRFDENSQISKINQAAGKEKVQVDSDVIAMLKMARSRSEQLNGALDVTVGALTELWGVGHKGEFIPSDADIKALLPLVDYRLVEINDTDNTVFLPKAGMRIDLGAVAKAYANRKAIDVLKAKGIKSALVNAGGDVRVIGKRPDGQPWRIGVQDPRDSEGIAAKLSMTDWDVLETSGDYQRFFMKDGVRYSHIIDPHTGYQPREIASITIVAKADNNVDILSTAMFVLGIEKGMQLLKQYPGTEAIFITTDGKKVITPGLEGKIEL
ncbi:FAD:protein FMN transferase [Sporomusa acidovorans]|uniref:FAD:protein FMN transferase n=1 Tax=Sporomusa acidovorans (strain ATCC 49682 / DSM 3132 / Mol) TaxID=1123286 RepID=A0ABZ3JAC9_SPOA4|nr:FAD:protein FMN transferase [Sporomusa acidovorans]OZC22903.1 thiamine biosynthesis lipoprotein ApbE precursor [Sporomusa acidovorans DSM 3132]SDE95615.1 thiamine biosynthesis lipoprotein [Sporomusa acidovorans]